MHKFKIVATSILSVMAATAVSAQQPQWVQLASTKDGDLIYFDIASQVRLFDAGVKRNTFTTLSLNASGVRRSLRSRYQADCLKGTLALHGLELVSTQGALIRRVPLDSADREAIVPSQNTIAADIWQYACFQF